jgi:hypothetical protein
LKEYVADFESRKRGLTKGAMPMAASILVGVLMVLVGLGLYELLALAVDKLLAAVDRRRNVAAQPGTPPPW